MSQKARPVSRVMTSSASKAYSARNSAVTSTASTPEPCNSSASTYEAYGIRSVRPIWSVESSRKSISLLAVQPITSPTTSATTADRRSETTASGQEKLPLTTAAMATW